MASDFSPEDQVLYFRPRGHVRSAGREYLLWPAWAYRVVAPRVRERQLNMFQRAVLGLCRAGLTDPESIGRKLSIHTDLTLVIMRELHSLDLLTTEGRLTKRGEKTLVDDEYAAHDMVSGYVFQDPWTGDLWPRFVEKFDYCDLEMDQNGFPTLVMGTAGKPYRQSAFMVFPDNGLYPAKPLPEKVVAAVAAHRKALKFNNDGANWEEESFTDFVPTNARIDRVSFVEESPVPVFLSTYLYLPEAAEDVQGWYVADPFGMGASTRLRKRVEQVMQGQPHLYNVVNRLVGRRLSDGLEEQKQLLEMLRQAAELEVEQHLSVDIRRHDAFPYLVDMASANLEVKQFGDQCPERKVKAVLGLGRQVLEAFFNEMQVRYPFGDIWKRVYAERVDRRTGEKRLIPQSDKKLYSEIYRSAAVATGFGDAVPESLLSVKPGQIRSVAQYQDAWRLRPLISATLLVAKENEGHPLREIAHQYPRFLNDCEKVASLGGGGTHTGDKKFEIADATGLVELVYRIAGVMTDVSINMSSDEIREGGGNNG